MGEHGCIGTASTMVMEHSAVGGWEAPSQRTGEIGRLPTRSVGWILLGTSNVKGRTTMDVVGRRNKGREGETRGRAKLLVEQ